MSQDLSQYWILGVAGLMLVFFTYRIVRYRGVRGAMLGARIAETVGEVHAHQRRIATSAKVRVHKLEEGSDGDLDVGLEIVVSGAGSWNSTPVALTKAEASELAGLLEQVAEQP